ncbi:MAG: hypothetical protein Q8Q39_02695 [bacterium]|nr:hypothetical protein [bacterium]
MDKPLVDGTGSFTFQGGLLRSANFGDFMALLNAVFTYLLYFAIPIAVIVFAIAGFMFLTSRGDPGRLGTAKRIFIWGAIGFGIVLLARGILAIIVDFLT